MSSTTKPAERQPFEIHPAANIFPMMGDAEFRELVEDIRKHGVREYIVLYDGQIIDGRNRYKAMLELGIDPLCYSSELTERHDPITYVLSLNLHRRHLTTGQRAMIAAELATRKLGDNQHAKEGGQNCPPSQEAAADSLGCSRSSVKQARKVLDHAAPSIVAAVKAGELSPSLAAEVAGHFSDHERQVELVADPWRARCAIREAKREAKRDAKRKTKKSKPQPPKPLPPPPKPLPPPPPPADDDQGDDEETLRDEANQLFEQMVKKSPEKMDLLRILFDAMDKQQRTWAGELWAEWQSGGDA